MNTTPRTIATIPDFDETVKAIVEQLAGLKNDSIIAVTKGPKAHGLTVLHRTGVDGWLATRDREGLNYASNRYLRRADGSLEAYLKSHLNPGGTVTVLFEGA